jgi:hypothetical protein
MPWTVLLVSSHLVLAADRVPEFDINPSCQAAAAAAVTQNRSAETCRQDELKARDTLLQEWSGFNAEQKRHCVTLSHSGGGPSYVELLTCLELAQQAAKLPPGIPLEGR